VFDAQVNGTQQGGTVLVNNLGVTNGLITVTIDPGAGVFTGAARWLDIAVRPGASTGAYTPVLPRQPITGTPYAVYALSAGNMSGAGLGLPATTGSGEGLITIGGRPALQMIGTDNAFVGGSGNLTMSGGYNTATGAGALRSNTSVNNNTAYGLSALRNTIGTGNIGIGFRSGYYLASGDNNIAIGHEGVAGESGTIRIGTLGGAHEDVAGRGCAGGRRCARERFSIRGCSRRFVVTHATNRVEVIHDPVFAEHGYDRVVTPRQG